MAARMPAIDIVREWSRQDGAPGCAIVALSKSGDILTMPPDRQPVFGDVTLSRGRMRREAVMRPDPVVPVTLQLITTVNARELVAYAK
jgi:hypothetical protein